MFPDFEAISRAADGIATVARDVDSRLEAIESLLRVTNVLLATIIAEEYGRETGYRADIQSVIDSAIMHTNKTRPDTVGEGSGDVGT